MFVMASLGQEEMGTLTRVIEVVPEVIVIAYCSKGVSAYLSSKILEDSNASAFSIESDNGGICRCNIAPRRK